MEVLTPDEVEKAMDKPWVSPYQEIIMCADEKNNFIEIHENHARGKCYGGAAWELRHYQETGSLVEEARREGAKNVFKLREGDGELDLVPSLAAAGIESAEILDDEIRVTYAGLAGAGVAVAMCRGLANNVKRVEIYEEGGGGKLGRAAIVVPKREKLTIGIDDTDTKEEGATWALSNEIGHKIDKNKGINYINHTIVQLYTQNPHKTQNAVGVSLSFAVDPSKKQKLKEEIINSFKEQTSSPETALAFKNGIPIPEEIKKYGKKTKNQMMEVKETERIAKQNGIELKSITGEEGKIGALAALGFSENPDEAVKVEK